MVGFSFSPIGRAIARLIGGSEHGDSREIAALREEVAQLRAELDAVQERGRDMDDVINRLEFAERVLAQLRSKPALPGGE
jgi:hypothetical protein